MIHVCSHLNEDFNLSTREPIPFLEIIVVPDADTNMISTSGIILQHLEINLQEVTASVDFNFIVKLVLSVMSGSMRNTMTLMNSIRSTLKKDDLVTAHHMLVHAVEAPDVSTYNSRMAYLKTLQVHSVDIKLKLNVEVAEVSSPSRSITIKYQ